MFSKKTTCTIINEGILGEFKLNNYDVAVIGGGPGGYTAAIRASQRGFKVVLFEKDCMGGVCLNRGCIPTKAILHCTDFYKSLKKSDKFGVSLSGISVDYSKIFERKNSIVAKINKSLTKLVESHGVTIVSGKAVLKSKTEIVINDTVYNCNNIIIATGSKPPQVKGLECDGAFVLNSNQLLDLDCLPENILIVGSGAIGVEWARIFSALGKTVTIIELAQSLLPLADIDVSKRLERLLKKDKVKFFTYTKIEKIENKTVILSNGQVLNPDLVLCAIGREPVMPVGLDLAKDGQYIKTDANFKTNYENIFAIGDVNGKMQLAHSAVHQAIGVIDYIADGRPVHFVKEQVPSVIYGNPEIAWVGMTEQSLEENSYKVSNFPTAALGKAQADDEIDGFVKILERDGRIVGAHAITPEASSIIQQFALMIDNNITAEQAMKTVFAHPTYSEATFEAILGLELGTISLPPQ